ncbi:Signal peptidase I [Rubellimicrobium mesophilum DSM 19309]|uniref:Signal peptidase I n=2 Tax=Rubellimicrobium TaxID=295418 RepID=A0A017HUK4_9RHOB|nr:Signal peptidase I [Rubellimicrobium mesophilum DSM 19309]
MAEPFSPTGFLGRGLDPTGRTTPVGFAALLLVMGALWVVGRLGPVWVEGWSRWHEALAAIPLAALLVPGTGHALRRLNDSGRPGWWAWALLVPWLRWALLLALLVTPSSQRRRRTDSGWRLLGLGVAGVAALVLAGSLIWTTAEVAEQGMKPALVPGDRVLVRRAPVTVGRGDVIAFRVEGEAAPRVARVVALGGERVAVEGGVPVIDGARAALAEDGLFAEVFGPQGPAGVMPVCGNGPVGLGADCLTHRFLETLPEGTTYAVLDAGTRPLDAGLEVEVPRGRFYVLGDHRDAARDSRLSPAVGGTGFVSEGQVIGRVDMVVASAEGRHWWDPRGWRPGRIGGIVR